MRFVDEVRLTVASGSGADGCLSFLREKFRPRGGPDGGNGGAGGAVIVEATRQRNTLVDFRWNKVYRAENGQRGSGRLKAGRQGEDLTLYVPVGTVLTEYETGALVADLDEEGKQWILEGGRGGRGNATFKTSTNRTPRYFGEGKPGAEMALQLELKLLADVGLLGFPNAGKSTLISCISSAKPKIADYPFTTLVPNLGVVSLNPGQSFVVADIPGLVEGAAEGTGLGHTFLRHIERCGVFLHLVSPDDDEHTCVHRFKVIEDELRRYKEVLLERPRITVLTKVDLLSEEEIERQIEALKVVSGGNPVLAISSVTATGLLPLTSRAWNVLQERRAESVEESTENDAQEFGINVPKA